MNLREYLIEDENQKNKPELTIEDFQGKAFPFYINRGIAVFAIKNLVQGDMQMDFNVHLKAIGKDLQRPLVWSQFQKEQLIISMFKGIELGKLTLIQKEIDKDKYEFQVIDGKQRLTTICDFAQNKFPIEWDGETHWFNNLSPDLQNKIIWYRPICDVGYEYQSEPIPDTEKIRWFELINFSGTPQDAEHLKALKQ